MEDIYSWIENRGLRNAFLLILYVGILLPLTSYLSPLTSYFSSLTLLLAFSDCVSPPWGSWRGLYNTSISSTSNTNAAYGGMLAPAPRSPYPRL